MRIETVKLAWFRGAADSITLDPNSKSMVVYGENASGKSSFIDAIEHVINKGKIGHLTHEYSGRHQEKGIINTHTPKGKKTEIHIKFQDGSELATEINRRGTFTSSGAETIAMNSWDYQRTVLRQDEVAAFIHERKGSKYSALLPLFGLHDLEVAAENIRQLVKSVEQQSKLSEIKATITTVEVQRKAEFGEDDEQINTKIKALHTKYCADKVDTTDPVDRCNELETSLNTRIAGFSVDQKKHLILQEVADLNLQNNVDAVRTANAKLAGAIEPFIKEKLQVLQSATLFVEKLEDEKEVICPACGRAISVEEFQAHVTSENERLQEISGTFNARKVAIGVLCSTLTSLKSDLGKVDVLSWRDNLNSGVFADSFSYLDGINAESLRDNCTEGDIKNIKEKLQPLIDTSALSVKDTLPDVTDMSNDMKTIEASKAVLKAEDLVATAARINALISFLQSLEQGIREEIKRRSQQVIDEISSDIQKMWSILHPDKAIEDVWLYLPDDTVKAIDIGLRFHGVVQDSPRLTLSESYRNSLGLCIFLAMSKCEASKDRPIFLDDVVVSFDRNHRGMIVELLEKEFSERQIVLLTHDREWYAELRHQLTQSNWTFKVLMPYENPKVGIRWSGKVSTFDDARGQLKSEPPSAGNTARTIMDIELAMRAERLKLKMPYLHRERNDHRDAHDFLSRIISDGKKCFKKRGEKEHEFYEEAIEAFRNADKLILSWANRGSHSFSLDKKEAEKLIDACEKSLEYFDCSICKKPVYQTNDETREFVQCQCGHLRWRYGKA